MPTVPLPPTGLTATGVSASSIALNWNASSDPSVTGYDVIEQVWVHMGHTGGHYVYNTIASNLVTPDDTLNGLTGSHTYFVTAVNSSGQSSYSLPASAQTWTAPTFSNSSTIFLLDNGALWSGPVNATSGVATQIELLISGTPLTYSVSSGPSTVSISNTGVVDYAPAASEAGTVNITFAISNALGSISQTVQFVVTAQPPNLLIPTLSLTSSSSVFTGSYQTVGAIAVGSDGKTPVAGSIGEVLDGSGGGTLNAGPHPVLVTFTSSDPAYASTSIVTTFVITPAAPTFNYLTSANVAFGTGPTTLSGYIGLGSNTFPSYEYAIVTVNGISQVAPISSNTTFATSFPTNGLAVGTYPITYSYLGDGANYTAAANGSGTLTVVPDAPPHVTKNPFTVVVSSGDGASFVAAATGSPPPSVQWQISTNKGTTWANITGNTSAQTADFTLTSTNTGENGQRFRAVFKNQFGIATSKAAILYVTPANFIVASGGPISAADSLFALNTRAWFNDHLSLDPAALDSLAAQHNAGTTIAVYIGGLADSGN